MAFYLTQAVEAVRADIQSKNAHISGAFNSKDLFVKTTNGHISAEFNVKNSASLTTTNGHISASGSLFSEPRNVHQTTELNMETTNGYVKPSPSSPCWVLNVALQSYLWNNLLGLN